MKRNKFVYGMVVLKNGDCVTLTIPYNYINLNKLKDVIKNRLNEKSEYISFPENVNNTSLNIINKSDISYISLSFRKPKIKPIIEDIVPNKIGF